MSTGRPARSSLAPWRGVPAIVAALALIVLVVVPYLGSLAGEFLWDDDLHVAKNPTIIGPLGLKEIWTTSRANYFPLVLTSFRAQHALWGLNPLGYHAVTLGWHVLAALLLWQVLRQIKMPGAWLGAAVWALHPVQVESVAWISEQKNTQSAVFFLWAIWFWVKALGANAVSGVKPDLRRADFGLGRSGFTPAAAGLNSRFSSVGGFYSLALLCALLALLSKPSTVMLPVVLALITWWRGGVVTRRGLLWLAPFFVLSLAASGWTIWEQKFHSGAQGAEWSLSWPERFLIAGRVVWFYLGKLVWPQPLSFIYHRWTPPIAVWPLLGCLVAGAVLWWRRKGAARPICFVAAYFIALLFPVLGFFDVYFFRYAYVGDHFQYLASMGPVALFASGIAQLTRRVALGLGAALLLPLCLLTRGQTAVYQNNTALWQSTVARTPDAVMAWLNLGDVLSWNHRYDESIAAYRAALRLRPEDPDGHNDLGNVLTLVGNYGEAVTEYERAIALKPGLAAAHNNLGNALRSLGRDPEAMAQYAEAVRLDPDYAGAHNNLGVELAEAGRPGEAIPHFEAALRARPDAVKARESLGRALQRYGLQLVQEGRWDEAVRNYQRAIEIIPNAAPFHEALAVALVKADRPAEAVPILQQAIRLAPGEAELHDNLGQILISLGRKREGFEEMEKAADLRRVR